MQEDISMEGEANTLDTNSRNLSPDNEDDGD